MGQTSPQARARPRRLGREAGGSLSCVREPRPSTPPSLKIRSRVQQAPNAESVRIKRSGVQAASVHRCRAEPRRSAGAGARRGEGGGPPPPGPPRGPPPPPPNPSPPRARRRSSQLGNPERNPAGAFQKAGSGRGSTDGRDGARGGGGSARTRGRRGRRAVARGRARGGVSRWGASPPPPPPSLFPHPPCP